MDLALHLGMTAGGLKATMTEREFVAWQVYAGRRMLPWRRVELALAQVAQLIAQTMGGVKGSKLADFLFDPKPDDEGADEATTPEDVAAFFKATLVKGQ
jgi:hypothetical protein